MIDIIALAKEVHVKSQSIDHCAFQMQKDLDELKSRETGIASGLLDIAILALSAADTAIWPEIKQKAYAALFLTAFSDPDIASNKVFSRSSSEFIDIAKSITSAIASLPNDKKDDSWFVILAMFIFLYLVKRGVNYKNMLCKKLGISSEEKCTWLTTGGSQWTF